MNPTPAHVPPSAGEPLATSQPSTPSGVLHGTVTYRQRIALPPNAVIEVALEEVSRADAPATVLASQTIAAQGKQPPVAFTLTYDPAQITPRDILAVRAAIKFGDQLTWISTQRYPVTTQAAPADNVEIVVQPVARPGLV